MSEFKIGDIVLLKSGSPQMTITGIANNHSKYICEWFIDKNDAVNRRAFPPEALKHFDLLKTEEE